MYCWKGGVVSCFLIIRGRFQKTGSRVRTAFLSFALFFMNTISISNAPSEDNASQCIATVDVLVEAKKELDRNTALMLSIKIERSLAIQFYP